tara:strand:+ start:438 stop:569 length:132 start_codon:yes stop_codon:yes gene_type:complete
MTAKEKAKELVDKNVTEKLEIITDGNVGLYKEPTEKLKVTIRT